MTLYFNNAVNTSWDTLGNWWTDTGCTSAAAAIPATGDTVIIVDGATLDYGPTVAVQPASVQFIATGGSGNAYNFADLSAFSCAVEFNSNGENGGTLTTVIFNDASGNQGAVTNATFNGSSYTKLSYVTNGTFNGNSQVRIGGVVTNGTFNDTSFNDLGTVVNGIFNDESSNKNKCTNGTFNDSSYNNNEVTETGIFNDTSFNNGSVLTGIFNGASYNASDGWVFGVATFNDSSYNNGYSIDTAIVRQHISAFLAWRNFCSTSKVTTLELKFPELDIIGGGGL